MTVRRPLVILESGVVQELPTGDTIPLPYLCDKQLTSSTTLQSTTSTTFVDLLGYTLTTKDLGASAAYDIEFNCEVSANGNDKVMEFQIVVDGTPVTYTIMQQNGHPNRPQVVHIKASSLLTTGKVVKVQFRSVDGTQVNVRLGSLSINGVLNSLVIP